MNIKLINSFKLLTEEECRRLAANIPDAESLKSDYHSYALEKGIDDSWFELIMNSVKNNNRMKIAISSISLLNVTVHSKTSIYKNSMQWGPDELEKKMRIFVPLFNTKDVELSVSVGNIVETFKPVPGYGYSWPAWGSLNTLSESNVGLINLDGTIIGRKLS
jgi:hypothetical protein